MVHTFLVRSVFSALCLFSITILSAQIEDVPASQEMIEEDVRGAPEEELPVDKSAEAYSGSTEIIVDPVTALHEKLIAEGHIVLEGIVFNNDNTLAIESDSSLTTISQMLKDNQKINVYIVGHTDNTPGVLAGMIASQKRAEAVMNALANRFGIDLSRLFASGVGPLAPITTNETEEGRARNNRIELVIE